MSDYWKDNNIEKPQQVVVCAACRWKEITVAGARHFDKVMVSQIKALMPRNNFPASVRWEQGFIDQFGDFLTREEAMKIAIAAGQKVDIKRNVSCTKLYSEGLY